MSSSGNYLLLLLALLLRYCTSLWPHSGQGKPPMFGDYEAQRHWQEVTVNIPLDSWYSNSTDNDLQYWGLDYPPLTAYHSLALGHVATSINSSYTALHTSRGEQSHHHKLLMRLSVIAGDLLVYLPACLAYSKHVSSSLVSLAFYPGLILIDHGHFQYNSISLGLFIAAVAAIFGHHDCLASLFFSLALNYKQMELYHALPFFFYLLARCNQEIGFGKKLGKLVMIATTVLVTFVIIWFPFIQLGLDSVLQVLVRLFPFNRGVFEDKVSNFWCALDVVVKLKSKFSHDILAKICLSTTFILALPSNLHLFFRPSHTTFLLSLCNTSLTFFLFSFQVHEKSILLAAIPIILTQNLPYLPPHTKSVSIWFLSISTFSMLPLLLKDGLLLPTLALSVLFLVVAHHFNLIYPLPNQKIKSGSTPRSSSPSPLISSPLQSLLNVLIPTSLTCCVIMSVLSLTIAPPPSYPFLWPLLISIFSAAHFILFSIYYHYVQFTWHSYIDIHQNFLKKNL